MTPIEKLTRYLLVPRQWDDQSKFLAQGGFSRENPHLLLAAIRELVATVEAREDGENQYGEFFRAEGNLPAPTGRTLPVNMAAGVGGWPGAVRYPEAMEGEVMRLPLYERVVLKRDLPEHGLKIGDVATLVEGLHADEVLTVRPLRKAV